MRPRRALAFVATALMAISGCRASVQANANADLQARSEENDETDDVDQLAGPGSGGIEPVAASGPPALLGARHDLRPAPSVKSATCQCLTVALGTPDDAKLSWQAQPPTIDPETQLVIALSSQGMSCPGAPADSLGASYWGYRRRGDDVVVIVEAARSGRPITMGAIIPKPFGSGQVYIEPSAPGLPYGKSLSGGGPCRLGNPGPVRTRPYAPARDETPEVDFSD